jgi:hypothetical protein
MGTQLDTEGDTAFSLYPNAGSITLIQYYILIPLNSTNTPSGIFPLQMGRSLVDGRLKAKG